MGEIVPVQKDNTKATFETMCTNCNMAEEVLKLIMASPVENLEDFRFYFATETEVGSFVSQSPELKDEKLRIQIARMHHAWTAVRTAATRRETVKTTEATIELDDPLEEAVLRDVKTTFWRRYRPRYPAEVIPSDTLVSRCHREIGKRLLTVFDVWTVKSLRHQVIPPIASGRK